MKIILITALCAMSFITCAAETTFSLPPETAKFKPGPGVELAKSQCSLCHSADYIGTQPRFTRTFWKAEVTKMQQKYGAPISTNNFDALADYLAQAYGKADTNTPTKVK